MDGDGLRTTFAWEDARSAELHPLDGERINIFHEAVGHHVEEGRGQDLAIRWLGRDGSTRDLTSAEVSPACVDRRARAFTRGTLTCRSKRSRSGPERRAR